jgi:hypothetical protein
MLVCPECSSYNRLAFDGTTIANHFRLHHGYRLTGWPRPIKNGMEPDSVGGAEMARLALKHPDPDKASRLLYSLRPEQEPQLLSDCSNLGLVKTSITWS